MVAWTQQINKHHIVYPKGISQSNNGKIPADLLRDVHDGNGRRIGRLSIPAGRSWDAMKAHAIRDGIPPGDITATDTFRTLEVQQRLRRERYTTTDQGNGWKTCPLDGKKYLKKGQHTAACPGHSNHGYAGAIDKGASARWHAWLEAHAASYGWEWELASEKWHLHYWPGDAIPQAVLDYEAASHIVTSGGDTMQFFGTSDDKVKDGGRLYLVRLDLGSMWYITSTGVFEWIKAFNAVVPVASKFLTDEAIHIIPQSVIEAIPLIPARS